MFKFICSVYKGFLDSKFMSTVAGISNDKILCHAVHSTQSLIQIPGRNDRTNDIVAALYDDDREMFNLVRFFDQLSFA